MKLVVRTVFFHLVCITFFTLLYFVYKDNFKGHNSDYGSGIDCFFLSTTIQAGVGITDIYPTTFLAKIIMIIQQLIMIMAHVFTIYIFTL